MKNELKRISFIFYCRHIFKMRTKRITTKKNDQVQDMCMLCKDKKCLVDHSKYVYSGRITRSVAKWLNYFNNFMVIEVYRSMPLLGDEGDIPNWDVHLVRYSITFL